MSANVAVVYGLEATAGPRCAVPVEFLSDDQAAAYERFVGELSRSELEGFFLLDGTALDLDGPGRRSA